MSRALLFRLFILTLTTTILFLTPSTEARRGGSAGAGRGHSGARSDVGRGGGRVGGGMSRSDYHGSTESRGYKPHGGAHPDGYFFKGAGSGHHDTPLITTEKIKSKFSQRLHTGDSVGSAFFVGYLVGNTITQPSIPFRLEDMTYFWGSEYLPGNKSTRVDITTATSEAMNVTSLTGSPITSNETSSCSIMKTAEGSNMSVCLKPTDKPQTRCEKEIMHLHDTNISMLEFPNGSWPHTLNWLCPERQFCCGWECCDHGLQFSDLLPEGVLSLVTNYLPFIRLVDLFA